jgi:hypothetical protein
VTTSIRSLADKTLLLPARFFFHLHNQPKDNLGCPSLSASRAIDLISIEATDHLETLRILNTRRKPITAMSVMLQTPSRASTASSSSFQPVSRQNTMSSHDGGRSVRQSKRYSMTTLYLSMSANEKDLEIEDDLAKGRDHYYHRSSNTSADLPSSPEDTSGSEV